MRNTRTRTRTLDEAFCEDIIAERYRQVEKWGIQHHEHGQWLRIFQEELGEAIKTLNEGNPVMQDEVSQEIWQKARHELVQAAAVLTAWVADEDSRF